MSDIDTRPRTLRGARRHKVFQLAELRVGTSLMRVHLLDLSATGARAHAVAPPTVGANVSLVMAGVTRAARVAWHAPGSKFGLTFLTPLTDQQVNGILTPGEVADQALNAR